MTPSLLWAVLASGFIYGITPGPGVLAVFGIGAARGRRAGAGFLCGHLLGDVMWCSAAGFPSGPYLIWKQARSACSSDAGSAATVDATKALAKQPITPSDSAKGVFAIQ